ncbi:hypothetical protein G5647_09940 [Pectobacterium carotovorum]|uniref:DUF6530 family protein n=1 Tax=Pectobacterium carotovorum TaxID=554 RepID=UPI00191F867D|nr:DUF6530 family protein [Pectobacterium carotovorum]MBL0866746.1 hypothetical protein [Pectobacterium carotovorum]
MNAPTHLKHKPVLEVADYNQIDGPYKPEETDAKALSLGLAQWNEAGETDLSVKSWREVDGRWSRLSEELPIHRALDLATLAVSAINHAKNGADLLDEGTFKIAKCKTNSSLEKLMHDKLSADDKDIHRSLARLAEELRKLGY